jgi:hypothetical protein
MMCLLGVRRNLASIRTPPPLFFASSRCSNHNQATRLTLGRERISTGLIRFATVS